MTSSGIGPAAGWALKHPQPLCIDTCCCIFACLYDDIVWYCMHLLSLIYLLSIHLTFPIAELMYLKLRGTLYIYIYVYMYICMYIYIYTCIRICTTYPRYSFGGWPKSQDVTGCCRSRICWVSPPKGACWCWGWSAGCTGRALVMVLAGVSWVKIQIGSASA